MSCCSTIKACLYLSLSIYCYRCSDGVCITIPAGCLWFLKQSSKTPFNLQSLASVLPLAPPVMGLVAHDPHHVSSYVECVDEGFYQRCWNEYHLNNLCFVLVKGLNMMRVKAGAGRAITDVSRWTVALTSESPNVLPLPLRKHTHRGLIKYLLDSTLYHWINDVAMKWNGRRILHDDYHCLLNALALLHVMFVCPGMSL